jgi:hypothetical protein
MLFGVKWNRHVLQSMGSTIHPIPSIEIHFADCTDIIDREDQLSVYIYLDVSTCYEKTLMIVMEDKEQEQDEQVDLTRLCS